MMTVMTVMERAQDYGAFTATPVASSDRGTRVA
jgi:hypothetical protein